MDKLISINLSSSSMKFAAAHFTLFSETERENLHGHNFCVHAELYAAMQDNGLLFDYGFFKHKFGLLCHELDEKLLIPQYSPYLRISEQAPYIALHFHQETLLFLPRDIHLLPISNITVECLAQYFLDKILSDQQLLQVSQVKKIKIQVASSPSQSATAVWQHTSGNNA